MEIRISDDIMLYLQFLYFQYTGLELLLKNFSRKDCKCENHYTYDQDVIDYYIKEFKAVCVEFENAKTEVLTQFKPEWLDKPVIYDFTRGIIKLESGA